MDSHNGLCAALRRHPVAEQETYESTSSQVHTLRRMIQEKDAAFQQRSNLERRLQELEQQGGVAVPRGPGCGALLGGSMCGTAGGVTGGSELSRPEGLGMVDPSADMEPPPPPPPPPPPLPSSTGIVRLLFACLHVNHFYNKPTSRRWVPPSGWFCSRFLPVICQGVFPWHCCPRHTLCKAALWQSLFVKRAIQIKCNWNLIEFNFTCRLRLTLWFISVFWNKQIKCLQQKVKFSTYTHTPCRRNLTQSLHITGLCKFSKLKKKSTSPIPPEFVMFHLRAMYKRAHIHCCWLGRVQTRYNFSLKHMGQPAASFHSTNTSLIRTEWSGGDPVIRSHCLLLLAAMEPGVCAHFQQRVFASLSLLHGCTAVAKKVSQQVGIISKVNRMQV